MDQIEIYLICVASPNVAIASTVSVTTVVVAAVFKKNAYCACLSYLGTFGQQTFDQKTFGQQTFDQWTFGLQTF